jgi:hypothetical protein
MAMPGAQQEERKRVDLVLCDLTVSLLLQCNSGL